jgi:hypothetical protein
MNPIFSLAFYLGMPVFFRFGFFRRFVSVDFLPAASLTMCRQLGVRPQ